jgi:hypothetical protein
MSGPAASNPLDVCGVVVPACKRNVLTRQVQNLRQVLQLQPHPASCRGYSSAKELGKGTAQRAPKGSSEGTFFSKFTLPEHSYSAALRQDTQHQHPQAQQTDVKSVRHPVQQHLPQQEIQQTGLSVQAPSSSNSDMLKVATVMQQIMTELSKTMLEKDKLMVITKKILNLMKQNGYQSS